MTTEKAAVAASTAQGWAHALNTAARPAPEHLEAAEEALNALVDADRHAPALGVQARWLGARNALEEALKAARARVAAGAREPGGITIAELAGALAELDRLGFRRADAALAQAVRDDGAADRIAELEAELEESGEELSAAIDREDSARAELKRQTELRDRFEREAAQARLDVKAAHAGHTAGIQAARDDSRRAGYRWVLAQLGNNVPGFDDMSTEELAEAARTRLAEVTKEAGQVQLMTADLERAGRRLQHGLEEVTYLPPRDQPIQLAAALVALADRSYRARSAALARQRELEDQLTVIAEEGAPELAAARAERDMLTRARDAQAAELRVLRAERDAAEGRSASAHAELATARGELERWTGAALELVRLMEPGATPAEEGTHLRAALAESVRRQLGRVSAIGDRLGREEQISAEQRRRAEAAELERDRLRAERDDLREEIEHRDAEQ